MAYTPEVVLPAPLDQALEWLVGQLGGTGEEAMFPILVGVTFGVLVVRFVWFDLMDQVMAALGHSSYRKIRPEVKGGELSADQLKQDAKNAVTRRKISMFAVKAFVTFVQAVMIWTSMYLWVMSGSWGKSNTISPFMWTCLRVIGIATTAVYNMELSVQKAPTLQWVHHLATTVLGLFIMVDSPSMSPEFALFWGAVGGALECPVFISMFIFNLYPNSALVRLRCVNFNLFYYTLWMLFFTPANLYFLYAHQAVMPQPAITAAVVSLIGTLPMQVYANYVYVGMRGGFLKKLKAERAGKKKDA